MKRLFLALQDVGDSFSNSHLWWWAGLQDIRLRYRRSTLGPWWLTISTGVMVAAMGFLYAGIFHNTVSDYLPHFAVGQVFWILFSSQITEATTAFTQFDSILKQVRVPLSSCVLRVLVRNAVVFAHNAVIVVIVFALLGFHGAWANLLVIPGFVILVITLFFLSLSVGLLCTRFRDLTLIVSSVLQILFFLSPIFWKAENVGDGVRGLLVKLNPVYYLIEVVRAPLFGSSGGASIWVGALFIMLASGVLALSLFSHFRHRLTYWL